MLKREYLFRQVILPESKEVLEELLLVVQPLSKSTLEEIAANQAILMLEASMLMHLGK